MISKKTVLTSVFLTLTAAAVGWEVVAVINPHDDLEPWTFLIADHVPPAITAAAIALLLSWLPGHFIEAYAERKGTTMTDPTIPSIPPPGAPREPLLSVGSVTAIVSAALGLAVVFGFKPSADVTSAILAAAAVVAPLVVAWLGRKKTFSPATVRAMVRDASGRNP